MDGLYTKHISGLENYVQEIDKYPWSNELNRRTQHYGARYDYKSRSLIYDVQPLQGIVKSFNDEHLHVFGFNQCIVNEYRSGQKITPHIDHPKLFGNVIVSLSLGSSMIMRFTKNDRLFDVQLNHGDCLLICNETRYQWKHELLPVNDPNFRRISITYRTIL